MKIGVLGGGQLGWMLALAGLPLGLRFRFLDPKWDAPAREVGQFHRAAYDDEAAVNEFARGLDRVTWEFENVPVETVRALGARLSVRPPPVALERSQDRVTEKRTFRSLGIPTVAFRPISSRAELARAGSELGFPIVLKTRTMGYDGKGQEVLGRAGEVSEVWEWMGGTELIAEDWAPFERELSIVGVRDRSGRLAFYPLVENEHRNGILVRTLAPAPNVSDGLQRLAESYLKRLLDEMGYVGVLALELFQVGGELLANEMAPRVHNSGHWTQDGAVTSQFENHLRAVAGFPLGSTEPVGATVMVNLLGAVPSPAAVLRLPEARLHLYGKTPRPGRKLGHVNLRGRSLSECLEAERGLEKLLPEGSGPVG